MKLHEWQERLMVEGAKQVKKASIDAGASEESADKAAIRHLENKLQERMREEFIAERVRHGATRQQAEQRWLAIKPKELPDDIGNRVGSEQDDEDTYRARKAAQR